MSLARFQSLVALITVVILQQFPPRAGAAAITTLEYKLTGSTLTVSPAALSVPKGIAGSILVQLTSSGSTNPIPISAKEGVYVTGILRGPSFPAREVSGALNAPLSLPPLNVVGDYEIDQIRLVDATTGRVQLEGTPDKVPVHVFEQVLVSQVTSRALSLDEVKEKGITIDQQNFRAVEFEVGFVLDGRTIPVRFPVVAPAFRESTEVIPQAELQARLASASILNQQLAQGATLPRELERAGLNIQVQGVNFQAVDVVDTDLALSIPPIPALVVIPGSVGFLNQFFSVQVFTENGAPLGSGLDVNKVTARIQLPPGPDLVASSNYDQPGDDPLRLARVGSGTTGQETRPVVRPGPDGRIGTPDDVLRLRPGESGQAEFLVEGLREGLHSMDIQLGAELEGLAAGVVHISGKAAGSVLVRNPRFSLTFTHPRTTRQGEPYDSSVTVLNTGNTVANLVRVTLPATSISGGELLSGDAVEIGTLQPGESGTAKFRVRAQKTGRITFSNLTTGPEATAGAFQLTMGIDERGVALSPDSIEMPDYVGRLPQGVVDAATRVLGQALGVATAGQLPAGVSPVAKSIITRRVLELAEAGQRLQYGDQAGRVLLDLLLDWQGGRDFEPGFDQLLRTTDAGREWRSALAAALEEIDPVSPLARFSVAAPDLAGRSEPWLIALVGDPSVEQRFGSSAGQASAPQPQGTAPAGSGFYQGTLGSWVVARPDPGSIVRWLFPTNTLAERTLALLVTDTHGTARQISWTLPTPPAGGCASWSLDGNPNGLLAVDPTCSGTPGTTLAGAILDVAEASPRLISVVQDLSVQAGQPGIRCDETQPAGGDNYGTVLAALFSKPMTQDRVNVPAAYSLDNGNTASSVQVQPGGRVALLNMRLGVGAYRPRTMSISGVTDLRDHPVNPAPVPVQTSGTNGVAIRGRVARADGTPAAGVPVTLTYYDAQVVGLGCDPMVVRVSQVITDASGLFDFDFVLTGVPYSISATDTAGLGADAINSILEATTADQLQNNQLAGLIRSKPESLLAAFGTTVASEAIARAEGLDRALLRDLVQRGSPRTGSLVPVSLVFRGRASVTGSVFQPDGTTPAPGVAVNLFPDPDSRELGRGVFSDSNGRFAFQGVPLGVFTIAATNNAGQFRVVSDFLLEAGGSRDVAVVLSTNAVVRSDLAGRVVEADNSTGHPSARVFVGRYDEGVFGSVVAVVTADADGYWVANGIPAATYDVVAVSSDGLRKGERRDAGVAPGAVSRVTIPLQGVATVRGRVEDSHGHPVPGALVAGGVLLVRTDPQGLFTLEGVPTGHRSLSAGVESDPLDPASFPRLGSASLDVIDGAANTVVIRLEAKGSLFGRVYDANGQPVPNVQVRIPQQGGFLYVQADDQGLYRFVGLPLDSYTLSASPESAPTSATDTTRLVEQIQTGSESQLLAAFGEAVRIFTGVDDPLLNGTGASFNPGTFGFTRGTLADDGQEVEADIHFIPTGSISGVTLNGQGFRIGARVRLTTLGLDGKGLPTTVLRGDVNSDPATGEFSFIGQLPAGPWGLQAASPFFPTVISRAGQTHSPDQLNETNVVLQFPADQQTKGRLTGVVTSPDGSAAPAGVVVSIPSQPATGTRQTDASGRYSYENVTQGEILLQAEDAVRGLKGQAQVTVTATLTNVGDLRLLGKGSLQVRVVAADGVTPVPGASVNLEQGTYPRDTLGGNRTDAAGQVTLVNLFEGAYAVCAQAGSGLTTLYGRAGATVEFGGNAVVTVQLTPTATLAGRFLLRDGVTPVPSAQVAIGNIGFTTTDANGEFIVGGIPLGTYRLVTQNPVTGVGASAQVTLAVNNSTNRVALVETSLGEVAGFVIGSYGTNLVPGATVTLRIGDGITPARSVTTGGDGAFRFPAVPAGPFTLLASDPVRGLSGEGAAILGEGQLSLNLTVRLEPLGAIAIRVVQPDGTTPARNVHVVLTPGNVALDTDPDGRVVFNDLRLGSYGVVARDVRRSGVATNAVVTQAGQRIDLSLGLPGTGGVQGRVLLSDGATPGAGLTVILTGQSTLYAGETDTVFSTADGRFSFTNVAVGPYQVSVVAQSLGASASGVIARDGEVDSLNLTLGASGRVTGRVTRADGVTLVAGAEVLLTAASQSGLGAQTLGRTDGAGVFLFEAVPVGGVALAISAPAVGGLAAVSRVLASNGQTLDLGTIPLDEASPEVVQVTPPNFSVGVSTLAPVDLVFSEAMNTNRLDTAAVFLRSSAGMVDSLLQVLPDTNGVPRILRITPRARLRSQTVYDVVVVDGDRFDALGSLTARGPVDLVGRPLAAPFLSRFSTADNDPPLLVSVSPADGASEVTLDAVMRLQFNESIRSTNVSVALEGPKGRVAGTVAVGPNALTLLFGPGALLEPNARYTLTVDNVMDLAGNLAVGQPYRFQFDSLDTLGPELASFHLQGDVAPVAGRPVRLEAILATPEPGARVRFQRILPDFLTLGEVTAPPFALATQLPAAGVVTYQATAFDLHGNAGTNRLLTLQIASNQPPAVQVTQVSAGGGRVFQGETVRVEVAASDDVAVTNILFVATGAGISFTTNVVGTNRFTLALDIPTNAPAGGFLQVAARAQDFAGLASDDALLSLEVRKLNHRPIAGLPVFGPGRALSFDGVDDLASGFAINEVHDSFTLELWLKPTGAISLVPEATTGAGALGGQGYAVFPAHGSIFSGPGQHAGAGVSVGTNGVLVAEHAPWYLPALLVHPASLSGWTHVAVVYQANRPSLYLNGVLAREGLPSERTVHPSVGLSEFPPYGAYQGELDEVRVWRGARSAAEILEGMHQRLVGDETNLVACFQLDEAGGGALTNGVPGGSPLSLGAGSAAPTRVASTAPLTGGGIVTNLTLPVTALVLPASDPDGDPVSRFIVTLPAHGTLFQTLDGVAPGAPIQTVPTRVAHPGGLILFRGELGYSGADEFRFVANDGVIDSFTAAARLTLSPPADLDSDGDGMPDVYEFAHGLNPAVDDGGLDPDSDGWSNLVEYQHGTDPRNRDTDGDGIPDSLDPDPRVASVGGVSLEAAVYARVTDPTQLAFAPDGTLYAGADATGSGGDPGAAVRIHRVAPGGGVTSEFGTIPLDDPDGVVVDVSGALSGVPGSVLVAGSTPAGQGMIRAIHPDETVSVVAGPSPLFTNPRALVIDPQGRLLFLEVSGQKGLWALSPGGSPLLLAPLPGAATPAHLAVDFQGRICVGDTEGVLRVFQPNGDLLDPHLAKGLTNAFFAYGPGGVFGRSLWVADGAGRLLTIDASGFTQVRLVGLGTTNGMGDLRFGPDGALYLGDFVRDRVLRIAPALAADATTSAWPQRRIAPVSGEYDLWDVHSGAHLTASSGAGAGPLEDALGAKSVGSPEPGHGIFQDGQPDGFLHFMEWRTASPVCLQGFRLLAMSDGGAFRGHREFREFHLLARPFGESDYKLIYSRGAANPYPVALEIGSEGYIEWIGTVDPIIAQEFRAEFVQAGTGGASGPRILELDGFGEIVSPGACVQVPSGLLHWYRGETGGLDSAGTANGSYAGPAGVPGKVGDAMEFDGVSGGMVIGTGNNKDLDFGPDDSFTFETWFNSYGPSPSGQEGEILLSLNYACSSTLQSIVLQNTGKLYFQVRDEQGLTAYTTAPRLIPRHEWHHIVAVREVSGGIKTLRMYLDGELADAVHDPSTGNIANPGALDLIGQRNWCGDYGFFFGAIDELSMYGRALSAEEVLGQYAAGVAGKCPACVPMPDGGVALWKGERDAVDSLAGLQGTMAGGVSFRPGEVGQAFQFNGTDGVVSIPDSPALSPHAGAQGAMSLGAWVYLDAYPAFDPVTQQGRRAFVSKGDVGNYEYALSVTTDGAAQFSVWSPLGGSYAEPAGGVLSLHRWHHVFGTLVKGAFAALYIDGAEVARSGVRPVDTGDGSAPLLIGRRADGSFFEGAVDEVSLYRRALTASEIGTLYLAGGAGVCLEAQFAKVALQNGTASHTQGGFSVAATLDGILDQFGNGWAPDHQASVAVWETARDLTYPAGSRLRLRMYQLYPLADHTIGRFRWSFTTDPRGTFADGLQEGGAVDAHWTVLVPRAVVSTNVPAFTLMPDGSILAGNSTPTTTYEVYADLPPVPVTGLRLELLEDPSLPANGPGFAGNKNLVLTELGVEAVPLPACFPAPAGLAGHWSMDGFDRAVVPSATSADGLTGGSEFVPGVVGFGRRVPSGAGLMASGAGELDLRGDQVSIEAWLKLEPNPDSSARFTALIGKAGFPDAQAFEIVFESGARVGLPNNLWQFEYILTTDDGRRVHNQSTGVQVPADGRYHHVALTYDGSTIRLFVDAEPRAEFGFSGTLKSVPAEPFRVAGTVAFSVDEIGVYNRALQGDEIAGIVAAGAAGTCVDCAPVPAGLAGWWPAERDGSDRLGLNPGQVHPGVAFHSGRAGEAFYFDGSPESYVDVGPGLSGIGGDLTIEGWIQSEPAQSFRVIAGTRSPTGDEAGWEFGVDSRGMLLFQAVVGPGVSCYAVGKTGLRDGAWHHVAATRAGGHASLFVDGVEETADRQDGEGAISSMAGLLIGRTPSLNDHPETRWKGGIDELSLYSRALEPQEIWAIRSAGALGKCGVTPAAPGLLTVDSVSLAAGGIPTLILEWGGGASAGFQVESSGDLVHWDVTPAVLAEPSPGRHRATVRVESSASQRFFRVRGL